MAALTGIRQQGRHNKTQFHQFTGKHALADLTAVLVVFHLLMSKHL
jgi:hypothetical protein